MTVYLCPAGNPVAQRHYEDTVARAVALYEHDWDVAKDDLMRAHPSGFAPMWGSTPGQAGRHRNKHALMRAGDIVLFYAGKRFFAKATVAVPLVDRDVALGLWGVAKDGETWELMFSFSDVSSVDLDIATFNAAVGYAPNKFVQGFSRLDDLKSQAALELFGVNSLESSGLPSEEDLDHALEVLDGPLDREVTSAARVEQRTLRYALVGGSEATHGSCALCGRQLPVGFLVAAHIKQRSQCSDSEKRDIPAIAMLACTFGCDALFERGYVAVRPDGRLMTSATKTSAAELTQHLHGRKCLAYEDSRAGYFAWHRENRFA